MIGHFSSETIQSGSLWDKIFYMLEEAFCFLDKHELREFIISRHTTENYKIFIQEGGKLYEIEILIYIRVG